METAQRRIMVVDDEVAFTRLLKLNLEQKGFEVLTVNTPNDAVAAARRFRPDLILLDVMMPELDGGTLAATMRNIPLLQTVPIIFLTAAVKKQEVASNRGTIGGMPFVAKPVELPELLAKISEHLPLPPAEPLPAQGQN